MRKLMEAVNPLFEGAMDDQIVSDLTDELFEHWDRYISHLRKLDPEKAEKASWAMNEVWKVLDEK